MRWEKLFKVVQLQSLEIVLDSSLEKLFSLDPSHGILCALVGTFISLVGMYTFPLTSQQRIQLIQMILPTEFGEDDAKKIFFEPGGFWQYILPGQYQNVRLGNVNAY